MKLYIINGPLMNMLGVREPELYGNVSYDSLVKEWKLLGMTLGIETVIVQSNHEGVLIDKIEEAYFEGADGIVLNPGAYTHTSIALADALRAVKLPTVEVHISDVSKREDYRKVSYVSEVAVKTITGHGTDGYREAIRWLYDTLSGIVAQ